MQTIFQDLGRVHYSRALKVQEGLFKTLVESKKDRAEASSHLLFCEHEHVYTLGKSGKADNLLLNQKTLEEKGISFYHTNRGGDITYHGLGQLVVYPIFDLSQIGIGLRVYIELLEECVITLLQQYGIKASRERGAAGVWIEGNRKICAIGVKSSRMITMHGLALNINTDLQYFDYINPCGFTDKGVTSIQKELQKSVNFNVLKGKLKSIFERIFGLDLLESGHSSLTPITSTSST